MKKILVIESQLAFRNSLERELTNWGYRVDVANDGQEGLKKINQFNPDCIVTSIVMPKIDGLELIMTVRRQRNKIPIVAMCSRERFGHCDYLDSAKHFGANDVIIKPFVISELISILKKHSDNNSDFERCVNYINLAN